MAMVLAVASAGARETLIFNREWRFLIGDHPGAEAPEFDDSGWCAIGLPHSFSAPCFAATRDFYIGYGWYRKHFALPAVWAGLRVQMEFDGVFRDAEVFVNGVRVGEHTSGYTGFAYDITGALHPGDNVFAIRVNNLWSPRLAPRAGEHQFCAGIYRDVRLVAVSPAHVAWYGTCITTPGLTADHGPVNIKTEVRNDGPGPAVCRLRTDIVAPDGATVASVSSTASIAGDETFTFDQTTAPVPRPKLWRPGHPWLYRAASTLLADGKPSDTFETRFGFRWFEFTPDKGFFLNGEHYYFKGANVHQDHAGWGDGVADSGFHRDVKLIQEAGFDFIRGSHYPHSPALSDACDELGVMLWSENCFWGLGHGGGSGFGASGSYPSDPADKGPFEQSVRDSLRDEIRIHRNHPSIVVWSMCNEPFFTSGPMSDVFDFLKRLVAYSHTLDATRPAGIGGAQRGGLDKAGDVAGYNGDGARLFINPGMPSVVTEYGSNMGDRPGKYEPGWDDLPNGAGQEKSQRYPWRSGEVIWCGFDHASVAGRRFGAMGIVDYFRLPKRSWYWYRNEYRHIPPPEWPAPGIPAGLALEADKTVLPHADGTDDTQLVVTVLDAVGKPISNSPPVTLSISSGPGEFPTGPSITFAPDSDIAIRDGKAAIEFRSYYAGDTVIRATSPGLRDASLSIKTEGGPAFIAGTTPASKRPYVRWQETRTVVSGTYGLLNPTCASSESPGHGAKLAADGRYDTWWEAADDKPGAWWQVDLEKVVEIDSVRISFPAHADTRCGVEASMDGISWKPGKPGSGAARYVRVTFAGASHVRAGIAELQVVGKPSGE